MWQRFIGFIKQESELVIVFAALMFLTGGVLVYVWATSPEDKRVEQQNAQSDESLAIEVEEIIPRTVNDKIPPQQTAPKTNDGQVAIDAAQPTAASILVPTHPGQPSGGIGGGTGINQGYMVTAKGIEEVNGEEVTYYLTFPSEGGEVSGTGASDHCQGTAEGMFDAQISEISGTFSGLCDFEGTQYVVIGTFSGQMMLEQGKGLGRYQGNSGNYSEEGSWELYYDPVR